MKSVGSMLFGPGDRPDMLEKGGSPSPRLKRLAMEINPPIWDGSAWHAVDGLVA